MEELLATVAHELRRPLTALLGALATLQQRGPALPDAQQQELLAIARRQGAQLLRLLEQLLAAATLDRPQAMLMRPSLVDAADLATDAGTAAQLAHPNHRIIIVVAGPLLVRADALAITQILGNLLDNAAAHAPAGSPVRLVGGLDGPWAVLAVLDQGPASPWRPVSASSSGTPSWISPSLGRGQPGARPVHRPPARPGQRRRATRHRPPRGARRPL